MRADLNWMSYCADVHEHVGAWVWSAHLVGFVRKEDLVEYLCGLVLYGVHLDQVRWIATGTRTGGGGGGVRDGVVSIPIW